MTGYRRKEIIYSPIGIIHSPFKSKKALLILHIQDLEIIDATPLLDIKPYVPEFNAHKVERIGWLENNAQKLSAVTDDGRFIEL